MGKTRLVETVLHAHGLKVLTGRGHEGAAPPYGLLAAALRVCLHERAGRVPDCGALAPYLGLILPELGPAPGEAGRDTLIEALRAALAALARSAPTALFLDDLHWADDATLEAFLALAERPAAAPLALLAAYRPEDTPRGHPLRRFRIELRRGRRLRELAVGPLGKADTAALIETRLSRMPAPSLVDAIFEHTRGLPLFVEEVVDALRLAGAIRTDGDAETLVADLAMPVPETVRDAVLLRAGTLGEPGRALLEAAAVLGSEFPLEVLLTLAPDDAGMEELFERGFLVETAPGFAAFRQALAREAMRGEIGWTRRRTLHRRAAEILEARGAEPAEAAEHRLAAGDVAGAARALCEAADRSLRLHAYRDAARFLARALEIWPPPGDAAEESARLDALERYAQCAQLSGQIAESLRAWRDALESPLLAADARRRGAVNRGLAVASGLHGSAETFARARRAAVEAFLAAGDPGEAAVDQLALAGRHTANLDLAAAREASEEAACLAATAGRHDVEVRAWGLHGVVLAMSGRYDEGREIVQRALSLALRHNLTEAASDAYRRLGSVLEYASDYAGSRDAYVTALSYCRTQGADAQATICLGCMSYVLFRTGDWSRAVEVSREVLAAADAPEPSRAVAESVLGLIAAERGEAKSARRHLAEAYRLARKHEVAAVEIIGSWGLALAANLEGVSDALDEHYRGVLLAWERTRERHDAIPALCGAASHFADRGSEAETTRCAEALAAIASDTGKPEALAGLAWALGEAALLHGDAEEAVRQFRQALSDLERMEIPLQIAHAKERLAKALLRAGRREEAALELTAARRSARKIGARPLARRLDEALRSAGAEPPSGRDDESSLPGVPTHLTPRQVEIVRLLAEGLTNKEIAERLFLSTRTVDMHVRNALDRLDCRTRTEAARRAAELGLLD